MSRPFTAAEISDLRILYEVRGLSLRVCADKLGRSTASVLGAMHRYGIPRRHDAPHYDEAELSRLRDLAPTRTIRELLPFFPHREYKALRAKLRSEGIPFLKGYRSPWVRLADDERRARRAAYHRAYRARKKFDFAPYEVTVDD